MGQIEAIVEYTLREGLVVEVTGRRCLRFLGRLRPILDIGKFVIEVGQVRPLEGEASYASIYFDVEDIQEVTVKVGTDGKDMIALKLSF